jgi:hypothetical protein
MTKLLLIVPVLLGMLLAAGCSSDEEVIGTTAPASGSPTGTASTTPSATATTAVSGTPTPTATAVVSPITSWDTYTDAATGFEIPIPQNAVRGDKTVELPAKNGYPAVQQRLISFSNEDGSGLVGVGVTPNPGALPLEDWIRRYPGWPSEPTPVTIAGEQGLRFSRNVMDEPADFIFFAHAGYIFELSGNVYGTPEAGYGPTITKADFDHVIDQFVFN